MIIPRGPDPATNALHVLGPAPELFNLREIANGVGSSQRAKGMLEAATGRCALWLILIGQLRQPTLPQSHDQMACSPRRARSIEQFHLAIGALWFHQVRVSPANPETNHSKGMSHTGAVSWIEPRRS